MVEGSRRRRGDIDGDQGVLEVFSEMTIKLDLDKSGLRSSNYVGGPRSIA